MSAARFILAIQPYRPPVSNPETERLLREAIKIIHANSRNINKDWLARARAHIGRLK